MAMEIAVGSIYYMRTPEKCMTLADALLKQKGVFLIHNDPRHWHRFGMKAGIEGVANKRELLQYINEQPVGGVCSHKREVYVDFDRDLKVLAQDRMIYAIYNADYGKWVAFP